MNKLIRCAVGFSLAMVLPVANAAIIDFEDYAAGTVIDTEYLISHGVTINGENVDRNKSNMAVVFDTDNYTGGDDDLESPFTHRFDGDPLLDLGVSKPGNVLIIHENAGSCSFSSGVRSFCNNPDDEGSRPAGYFDIAFSSGVMINSIDFFDVESAENGTSPNNLISLFDISNNEIAKFYTPNTGGDNKWDRLDFNVSNVWSMRIKLHGSGAIDNINYSVSEPGTLALLGLGLLGLVAVRKKS